MENNTQQFPSPLDADKVRSLEAEALLKYLSSDLNGLSVADAQARLAFYGLNTIQEKRKSIILKFLSYFWGPIAWIIETAAILSAVVHNTDDLVIILILLFFNAIVGFWQEYQAGNAIEQLKKNLALKARVFRDGQWLSIDAVQLVPGDKVKIRLGDVVPADIALLEGDYLSIDQSALTGESLPVDKRTGDLVYSSSIAKQGEMTGVVTGTGVHTYFWQNRKTGQFHHQCVAFPKSGNKYRRLSDFHQFSAGYYTGSGRTGTTLAGYGIGTVCADSDSGLHSRCLAGSLVSNDGGWCHKTGQIKSHCFPAGID